MKLLILGGTVFLGRHLVTAGVERGHEITIFTRGRHDPEGPFPDVERLRGDRDGNLAALDRRRWDAVVDTSGNQPYAVQAAAERLADRVAHYAFISTLAVYDGFPRVRGLDEDARLRTIEGAAVPPWSHETAALHKAMCERALTAAMPERHLIVRAGFLAGPYDPTDRFTYWPRRIAMGGEVLAPGDPNVPVQLIDARDLARWILAALEAGIRGAYNATGPAAPLTMQALFETCRDATGSDARFTWVDDEFLLSAGVKPLMELPVWMPGAPDAGTADCRKALRDGLDFRPLAETVQDTLAWDRSRPESAPRRAGLAPEREAEVLAAWAESRGARVGQRRRSTTVDASLRSPSRIRPPGSPVTQTGLTFDTIVLFASDMAASRSFYEQTLGLRARTIDSHAAVYSAGHVQLCVLPAAEHGVVLADGLDRSVDITFMVDDFARCHDALEARGLRFSRTLEYSIGITADFFDPDGHWFSLYEASDGAMRRPSGDVLRALTPAATGGDLADAFIAYLFLFFSDPEAAAGFYGESLGLDVVEGGRCRRVPTDVESGVIKYDVGTTMLTTHHVDSDDRRFRVATVGTDGIALAFRVAHLARAVDDLSRRGIVFSDSPSDSPLGRIARFTDPAGHVLLLREPTHVRAGEPALATAEK